MDWFANAWRAMYASMVTAAALSAQTFTTLVNFDLTNGAGPARMAMIQGLDGNLYGTTSSGGSALAGTIFKITPSGALTTLHSFVGSDGSVPLAGLVLATDGNFYGTTSSGGTNGFGTVFKMTPGGTITTLYSFCPQFDCFAGANAGANPSGALIQATSGELYGTTAHGGSSANCSFSGVIGCGTVFEISTGGVLATMHSFDGTDGLLPMAALVQAANGNFYGTTSQGGVASAGTVFEITPGGRFTSIHSFSASDGAFPFSALVQATNGYLYGTTANGGASVGGTAFRVSEGGALTTIHNFDGTDGFWPSTLVQGDNGDFYATSESGGGGVGNIFKMTPSGTVTSLHSFSDTDGCDPQGALGQATNGTFFGTTLQCGEDNQGTLFSLSVGLPPFVIPLPTAGSVGATVRILGTDLTGTTGVTFNGTPAGFTVVAPTEVTTAVPSGATTGRVHVTSAERTLSSTEPFLVKQ